MNTKIKIAHVVGGLHSGGVEAVIYNYFSHMDMDKFEVHIISNSPSVYECENLFRNLGCIIHVLPERRKHFTKNLKQTIQIFKKEQFDILHCHMNLNSFYHTFLGMWCHIKVRIAHSHLVEFPSGLPAKMISGIKKVLNRLFATHYFACGISAGEYLFGRKNVEKGNVYILKNAIEVDKFLFRPDIRMELRQSLGIGDSLCVGHIGRFTEQKNHTFLIDIFRQLHGQHPNSLLLLFGTGEEMVHIKELVQEKGLSDCVRFMGVCNDIERYYQVMDAFLFPSLYEGLGIVLVEAQASGLPCVSSDVVPQEAKVSDLVTFLPLSADASHWADVLYSNADRERSVDMRPLIAEAGYDITLASGLLENWYMEHRSGR